MSKKHEWMMTTYTFILNRFDPDDLGWDENSLKYRVADKICNFVHDHIGLHIESIYCVINDEFYDFNTGETMTLREYLHWAFISPIVSFIKYRILRMERVDEHLGCPSWPNCDLAPLGCRLEMGTDVEWYGYKDPIDQKEKK